MKNATIKILLAGHYFAPVLEAVMHVFVGFLAQSL